MIQHSHLTSLFILKGRIRIGLETSIIRVSFMALFKILSTLFYVESYIASSLSLVAFLNASFTFWVSKKSKNLEMKIGL